jgi:predicted nucleic acid-binding protein
VTVVVDASVALKWFVTEDGSEAARSLHGAALLAPELIVAEVANGLWRMARCSRLLPEAPRLALARLPRYFAVLEPLAGLAVRASEIAAELDHPVYDAFYLALAEANRTVVVTADRRLLDKAAASALAGSIRGLNSG